MKSVLVTGVFGHIGFAVANELSKYFKVFGSYNVNVDANRKKILIKKNVKLIKNNFKNEKTLNNFLNKNKIESCVYCAGVSHEIFAKKKTYDTIQSNVISLLNILNYCKNKKFKLIYISTGSVFQKIINEKTKINENTVPTPLSIYSGSKRLGEILIQSYKSYFSVNAAVLRVSWVYGPEVKTKKVDVQRGPIPYLINLILEKKMKTIRFKSGGDFKASFTYIKDLTNAVEKMISNIKPFQHSIYQLSTEKNYSNYKLAECLMKIFPKIKIIFGKGKNPWSNDSVVRGPMKGCNLKKEFQIYCKYNLYKGLKDMILKIK